MKPLSTTCLRWGILACMAAAGPAVAGQASLFSYNGNGSIPPGQTNQFGNGYVTVEASNPGFYGQANAYEFLGGVGASAFATSRFLNMQAFSRASFIQTLTVECADSGGFIVLGCFLPITIVADGTTSVSGNPASNNPTLFGSATAKYSFNWAIGGTRSGQGASGFGEVDERINTDGTRSLTIQGNPSTTVTEILVFHGDRISLSMSAGVFVSADNIGDGGASAAADFSHTLRWGGVSGATSGNGLPLAPGQVRLLGGDGFDYMNAAPPNPFTTPVPEASTWAMLVTGLGLLGFLARRRCREGAAG